MTGAEPGVPEQEALFEIEGPDEDSCVWLVSGSGDDQIVVNLGPRPAVTAKLKQWLASIGQG